MGRSQPAGMRAFIVIWAGQLMSLLGTSMTQFALTIWAWEFVTRIRPTGDPATAMALVGFFNFAPQVLLSPVAGALVDRWNRKLVMMLSDLAAGLATIAVFLLYAAGSLELWHLYLAGAFTGAFQSFQFPAYSAAISTMVPKTQYTRANALMGLAESASGIAAPPLAAALLAIIGIGGVLLIDIISFLAAIGALLFVFIPQPPPSAEGAAARGGLRQEITFGFHYIFRRPSLLGLQLVFLGGNLLGSFGFALLAPMILSRSGGSEAALGLVQAALGVGGVVGGLLLATWGGPKRRVHGVLGGHMLEALLGITLLGLGMNLGIWVLAAFFSSFFIPIINGANQSIWQSKVPPDIQGKVFAARRMIAQITGPVGFVLAGPLADRLFEPAMRPDGALAAALGPAFGTGPGSGMAVMFVLAGFLAALVGLSGYLVRAVRNAEDLLPDHDAAPAG